MFEKEAEERTKQYMNEHTEKYSCEWTKLETDNYNIGREQGYEDGFRDGAEFGFQKGLKTKINTTTISDYPIKEDEWKYPSKGEYPKECENVLCYCKGHGFKFCCVGHIIIGGDNKVRWWANNKSEELRVIAWKEIVPPKFVVEE